MATKIIDILVKVRRQLMELSPRFWKDDELTDLISDGVRDLYGAVLDLHQDHQFIVDETHVVLKANTNKLSGVPEDCFRVQLIEPRDISADGSGRAVIFVPRKYKHPDFVAARTQSAVNPSSGAIVYFQMAGPGAPVRAPEILIAPQLTSDLTLRLAYNPSIKIDDVNPIPGDSDNALKAWAVAYARAKETPDRQPDLGWLGTYEREKQAILVRLTPRQEQEEDAVEDFFAGQGNF